MSIDGTYDVTVETPMGAQRGKLTLDTSEDTFSGTLETKSGATRFIGGRISGNLLSWSAETKTPLGTFQVDYRATIDGGNLSGEAITPLGAAPLRGKKN